MSVSKISHYYTGLRASAVQRESASACQSLSYCQCKFNTSPAHLCNWSTWCHFSSKLMSSKWLTAPSRPCCLKFQVTDTSIPFWMFLDMLDKNDSVESRVWQGKAAQKSFQLSHFSKSIGFIGSESIKDWERTGFEVCYILQSKTLANLLF